MSRKQINNIKGNKENGLLEAESEQDAKAVSNKTSNRDLRKMKSNFMKKNQARGSQQHNTTIAYTSSPSPISTPSGFFQERSRGSTERDNIVSAEVPQPSNTLKFKSESGPMETVYSKLTSEDVVLPTVSSPRPS